MPSGSRSLQGFSARMLLKQRSCLAGLCAGRRASAKSGREAAFSREYSAHQQLAGAR